MAYGQQTAYRVQETEIHVGSTSWVALQASSTFPSTDGVTTPLEKRFSIKVFNVAGKVASRLALSYDNTVALKDGKQWLGTGGLMVEPASTGLTLYGRAKLISGNNTIRVMVTEYGH